MRVLPVLERQQGVGAVTETKIQIALVRALRAAGCLVIASANGAKLSGDKAARARQWRRLEAMGALAGAPDLWVSRADRGHVWLEVKAESGRISREQAEVLSRLLEQGERAFVVRGLDQALVVCRGLGLL